MLLTYSHGALMLHVDANGQMVAEPRRNNSIVKETAIGLGNNRDTLAAGNAWIGPKRVGCWNSPCHYRGKTMAITEPMIDPQRCRKVDVVGASGLCFVVEIARKLRQGDPRRTRHTWTEDIRRYFTHTVQRDDIAGKGVACEPTFPVGASCRGIVYLDLGQDGRKVALCEG